MLQVDLGAALATELASGTAPLDAAADLIREQVGVDRVSISTIDEVDGHFEIQATSGGSLLVRGTRLPVATSSHFLETAERRVFVARSFERLASFGRPLDEVVRATGFNSGCAVPITLGDEVLGTLALSWREENAELVDHVGALVSLGGTLAMALSRDIEPETPTTLVLHDDPLVAQGLAKVVEAAAGSRAVVASTTDDAVALINGRPPELIICDDWVGGRRVDRFASLLRQAGGGAPLLVVATHDTPENVAAAIEAGAAAYIPRAEAQTSLQKTMVMLRAGRTVLPPPPPAPVAGVEPMTPREREVLACLEEGLRMKQIAWRFKISESTAKCHARNVFRKLRVSSRAEAVREARRQGMLT